MRNLIAALALGTLCAAAQAQYPNKPIKIIVPFPAGSATDTISRILGNSVSNAVGQPVLVENKAGADGAIAASEVMRAAPDGYTLLVNTTPFVVNTHLMGKVPYDVLNDFVPVSLLSSSPSLLTVHPSLPARSVRELLALAKSRPGALNYSSAGIGTNPHIAGELFNHLGKVNIVAIHYKGGGPGLVAAASGEVVATFTNIAETTTYVRAGRLRAIGVSSLTRSKIVPEVPTVAESGMPGYEFVAWFAMLAPKGTSRPVAALLNERVRKALAAPDLVRRFEETGLQIIASTPEELTAHLRRELDKWGPVIRERGMRAE